MIREKPDAGGLVPLEYQCVIALDAQGEKIGSIIMPSSVQEKDKLAAQEGTLVAISPHAFSYADSWPEGSKPEVGQRVLIRRYAGVMHDRENRTYRLVSDKDIIAIVQPLAVNPADFVKAA